MIQLAQLPEPHRSTSVRFARAMVKAQNMLGAGHRSIPVREPDPEPIPGPNPEPDATISNGSLDITPADWDALFSAVTDRLEDCSGPAPLDQLPGLVPEHGLGMTPDFHETVRECVDAMHRLHVALPSDWHQHKGMH